MLRHFILLIALSPSVWAAEDTRQKLDFPSMMQQHMLANMRDHLTALMEIQQAMASGHYDQAAEVAEQRLGLSSLDNHGAAHMADKMPPPMQAIGTAMHQAASRFAVTVTETGADGNLQRAVGALGAVMQQCVACHSAYRVH